jgi:hypothetical protein
MVVMKADTAGSVDISVALLDSVGHAGDESVATAVLGSSLDRRTEGGRETRKIGKR